jgi:hypothetical protein
MDDLDSEWRRKGAILIHKTAQEEFGLTWEEIVRAKGAEILRQSFEAATGRGNLRPLTLSALQESVSKLDIFRTTEAWCPGCPTSHAAWSIR